MGSSPTLSACMIVRDEAHQIAEALTCLRGFADEIIVVDTGSTDETKAIALQFTPHVFDFPWCDDFSAARNISLDKASCDYILWFDADDRFDSENQEKMRILKSYFNGEKAFYLILQDIETSGQSYSFYQLRCAPRRDEIRFRGRIHEHLMVDNLKFIQTDIVVEHHGYKDSALLTRKIERNLSLLEKERAEGRDNDQLDFYLALSYDQLGRQPDAIRAMERALKRLEGRAAEVSDTAEQSGIIPDFLPEAHIVLAELHVSQGESEKALRHMAKAQALGEDYPQILFRLGSLYQALRRHVSALDCLKRAILGKESTGFIPRKPLSRGTILVQMAFSFLCLNQASLAMGCIREAWKLGIPMSKSWEELGYRALQSQELSSALQAYEHALESGELSIDGYCNLGLLYSKANLTQKAIQCYQAVLRKEPHHQTALANLAHLSLKLGHLRIAKGLFEQLLAQGIKDMDILLAPAFIAATEKDWRRLKELEQLLRDIAAGDPAWRSAYQRGELFAVLADQLESNGKAILADWARQTAQILESVKRASSVAPE